jgi:hypothetical protein
MNCDTALVQLLLTLTQEMALQMKSRKEIHGFRNLNYNYLASISLFLKPCLPLYCIKGTAYEKKYSLKLLFSKERKIVKSSGKLNIILLEKSPFDSCILCVSFRDKEV